MGTPAPRNPHTNNWTIGTRVAFDQNTAATHVVVAGAAGKTIRILHWVLGVAGSTDVNWASSVAGAISDPLLLPSLGSWEGSFPFEGYETTSGEGLSLTIGSAVRIAGSVWYEVLS